MKKQKVKKLGVHELRALANASFYFDKKNCGCDLDTLSKIYKLTQQENIVSNETAVSVHKDVIKAVLSLRRDFRNIETVIENAGFDKPEWSFDANPHIYGVGNNPSGLSGVQYHWKRTGDKKVELYFIDKD